MTQTSYAVRGTGNSVADYSEDMVVCEVCKGEGQVQVNREGFVEYLENVYRLACFKDKRIFKRALSDYRIWKASGLVKCDECDGYGTWTERF